MCVCSSLCPALGPGEATLMSTARCPVQGPSPRELRCHWGVLRDPGIFPVAFPTDSSHIILGYFEYVTLSGFPSSQIKIASVEDLGVGAPENNLPVCEYLRGL